MTMSTDDNLSQADPRRNGVTAENENLMGALWYLADRTTEIANDPQLTPEALVREALENWERGFAQ